MEKQLTIGDLKQIIKDLPDSAKVIIYAEGYYGALMLKEVTRGYTELAPEDGFCGTESFLEDSSGPDICLGS